MCNVPTQVKPQPEFNSDTHNCKMCSKCGGTGFYCMGVQDGQPWSLTGFTCYGCNGTGWKVTWKRGTTEQRRAEKHAKLMEAMRPHIRMTGTHAEIESRLAGRDLSNAVLILTYTD